MLLHGMSVCFRQYLHLVPCVRGLSGVDICLARLIGCNRLIHLQYTYTCVLVSCFSAQLVSSVLPGRFPGCASLSPRVRVSLSLSPLFSSTLRSKTAVVPPSSPRTRVATRQRKSKLSNKTKNFCVENAYAFYSLPKHYQRTRKVMYLEGQDGPLISCT